MRTLIATLVALAITACGPEPVDVDTFDEPGSPDRIAFAVEDEQDDETETGSPDMMPEPQFRCCTCEFLNCYEWDDDEKACEVDFSQYIGDKTAWCEVDDQGGVSGCASICY